MPLLTWALSSAGYGDAASYIANFRFKAHSGLIEGPHGFNHNDGYENLPCSSFAWPVIGVFSYLVFIFIGTRYDRWARRRVENLLQKESHPQQVHFLGPSGVCIICRIVVHCPSTCRIASYCVVAFVLYVAMCHRDFIFMSRWHCMVFLHNVSHCILTRCVVICVAICRSVCRGMLQDDVSQ